MQVPDRGQPHPVPEPPTLHIHGRRQLQNGRNGRSFHPISPSCAIRADGQQVIATSIDDSREDHLRLELSFKMLIGTRPSQRWVVLLVVIPIFLLVVAFHRITLTSKSPPVPALSPGEIPNFELQLQFWNNFRRVLDSNPPGTDPPKRLKKTEDVPFDPAGTYVRPDLLLLPETDIRRMRKAHERVVRKVKSDSSGLDLIYNAGTKGIVTAAGGTYLPSMLISLRLLRETGTQLPVEVFIASKDEYDGIICETILPTMNAHCVVLSDLLGPSISNLQHYQYKAFALLFSSFESVLWLDADAFPLHDVADLFQSAPFIQSGLVTWPDFFVPATSPTFYTITSQPIPPLHLRPATDGAHLLISKKTHEKTLLLAAYYNYYGPSHYYRLLSQGATGEGDKETFLAAASLLEAPFYAVREPIRPIGHRSTSGKMTTHATVQYSPADDFQLTSQGIDRAAKPDPMNPPPLPIPQPMPFFIHSFHPKINPVVIFGTPEDEFEDSPIWRVDGKPTRAWVDDKETVDGLVLGGEDREDGDVEKEFWSQVRWVACMLEDTGFKAWRRKGDICRRANEWFQGVFER
ncbi:hypothetical protein FQN55_009609 [Onygenales sp. PD_40]|nr:hypothetical protein FQN55_009609 [Onygenales sp. PD_40]